MAPAIEKNDQIKDQYHASAPCLFGAQGRARDFDHRRQTPSQPSFLSASERLDPATQSVTAVSGLTKFEPGIVGSRKSCPNGKRIARSAYSLRPGTGAFHQRGIDLLEAPKKLSTFNLL